MTAQFDLALSKVAHYRWGSLAVSFDRAQVRNRASFDAARRESHLDYSVENDKEARELISFLHEFVHYAQDLDTGVGHWDDYLRRRWLPECVVNLRGPGSSSTALPFPQSHPDEDLNGDLSYARGLYGGLISDQQLFRRDRTMPAARAEAIARIVNEDLGTDYGADETANLWPEALFEGEAAATVYSLLLKGKVESDRRELLTDISDLWDFFKLPGVYQSSFQLYMSAFDGIPDDPEWLPETAFDWFSTLVDIACAYPSPASFQRHRDVDRAQFEPGIKFLRMVRALAERGREVEQAIEEPETLERILLDTMSFRYPTAREVYADWADWLDKAVDNSAGVARPVLIVRRDSARRRAAKTPIVPAKTPMRLTIAQLPLLMVDNQGPHQTWQGRIVFDQERQAALVADSMYDAMVTELVAAMLDTGRFRCPLAVAGYCRSAQEGCRRIKDLRHLPGAPACHVRDMLEVNGYHLAPPPS